MFTPFGGFDFMFSFMPILVVAGFILVFGIIIVKIVQGGITWNKNNNSPVLTVTAKIVTKRAAVSSYHHHHAGNMHHGHHSTHTTYYATFEVESGDRMELTVPSTEYGLLVEGDTGKLTFQGTRYKGFQRSY